MSVSAFEIPTDFKFSKTLKQGDTITPDVSYLQYVLNQDTDTEVSASGVGSLNNLTNFFGAKTKSAVLKFQEKYRDEILTPSNLTSATGVVGERTRTKLNQILSSLFSGTYISTSSKTPTVSSLQSQISSPKIFTTNLTSTGTSTRQSTVTQPPVISSFSVFRALSGQLMSIFGARFHPTKNTLYLGSTPIGEFPSSDNGTKITFQVPARTETGSYEIGLVNTYGTTSTGYTYLNITKPDQSSSSVPISFEPVLTTLYPNTSRNMNDLIYIYGENLAFSNTLETNLGNIIVRSSNRKTLSFIPSELPYYTEAFKKYKGQSINLLIKIRNENGLSKQQLVHVIQFPNTATPTVNLTAQLPPADFTVTSDDVFSVAYRQQFGYLEDAQNKASSTQATNRSSTGTTTSSSAQNSSSQDSGKANSSSMQLDPATQQLADLAGQDPALQLLRQTSPVHKFATDPLVGNSSSGSSGNSSGGGSGAAALGGVAAAGALGGSSGGSSGGGSGGTGAITYFGGQITQVTYCTCSGTILLGIRDIASKQTLQVFFRYGQSTLRANYNIFTSGINVLGGLTQGGGACEVYSGNSCTTQGNAQYTIDTIRGIGTAASPGN
jgi:hypothetical protein